MVKERNDEIGCCYIKYQKEYNNMSWYGNQVTCNYKENNFLKEKTYTRGTPASQCNEWGATYGPSQTWENLCAERN